MELNYRPAIVDLLAFAESIRTIRTHATETPIRELERIGNDRRRSSTVRDGFIQLAEEKKLLLDRELQEVKMRVSKAQLMINRA